MSNEKNKTITLTDEEHNFLVEELGENRARAQELLDDEIISLEEYDDTSKSWETSFIKSSIEGYKKGIKLFNSILKKL